MESTEPKTPTPEEQDSSTPATQAAPEPAVGETAVVETPVAETQASEAPDVLTPEVQETPVAPATSPRAPVTPAAAPTPGEPNFFQQQRARTQAWIDAKPTRAWITLGIILLLLASILM